MTSADSTKSGGRFKLPSFKIYKPGQGKYVRWGTVAGLGIVVLGGAYWLAVWALPTQMPVVQAAAAALWILIFGGLTFWAVNAPNTAEFMIATESEMRKVSWPSRREVITSTKVVITLTILLGVLLWLVDVGFLQFFRFIKIQ